MSLKQPKGSAPQHLPTSRISDYPNKPAMFSIFFAIIGSRAQENCNFWIVVYIFRFKVDLSYRCWGVRYYVRFLGLTIRF